MLTPKFQQELIVAVLSMEHGKELHLQRPAGLNYETFRADIFKTLKTWPGRKTIKIKSYPPDKVVIFKYGDPFLTSPTFSNLQANPSKKFIDEAPEKVHNCLENWMAEDKVPDLNLNPTELHALFLYLLITQPWEQISEKMTDFEHIKVEGNPYDVGRLKGGEEDE